MLTLKDIKSNQEDIIKRLKLKGFDATQAVETLISLDEKRIELQVELDNTNAELNSIAKEVGMLFKQGKTEEANQAKERTSTLKDKAKEIEALMSQTEADITAMLITIPNTPHPQIPHGKGAEDNVVVKDCDFPVELPEGHLPHWELAKKYDIIDFELGNKLAGAGFPVYKGMGARLQRALISYFLDHNTKAGYQEMMPPIVANEDSAYGTGQLPDKEGQMYHITADNLYMIPTAEVPLTNIFRDTIVNQSDLPIKITGYTPCFRREAGSYGKEVRGLNRLHQFDKVEIVQIQHPDNSYNALGEMVMHVEQLLKELELPYRILSLCGGDISFTSAMTFDFEVYSASQARWLEVSSVSNFETFQANRLKLRFRGEDKKNQLVHTLNGSSLALPRIVASLLENNQTEEGIKIPAVLVPYMGGVDMIK